MTELVGGMQLVANPAVARCIGTVGDNIEQEGAAIGEAAVAKQRALGSGKADRRDGDGDQARGGLVFFLTLERL